MGKSLAPRHQHRRAAGALSLQSATGATEKAAQARLLGQLVALIGKLGSTDDGAKQEATAIVALLSGIAPRDSAEGNACHSDDGGP